MARASRALSVFTSLQESGAAPSVATAAGRRVYRGVTIIKSGLGNRRDRNYYPTETLEKAVASGQFRNLKAYADHQDTISEEVQPERTIRDMVGVYKNDRFVKEGSSGRVTADLHLFRSSRWLSDTIDDLIDLGQTDNIGLSINGRGQTVEKQMSFEEAGSPVNVNYVEAFTTLRSADVVTEAGAGGGFQQLLESAQGTAHRENTMKRLTEAQKHAIKAAVDAGDLDKLTAVLTECGCMAAAPAKEAKAKGKGKAAPPPVATEATEADEAEEDDADALDEAVDAAKQQADELDPDAEAVEEADDEEADEDLDVEVDDADEEADEVEEAMGHLPGGAGKIIPGSTKSGPGKATIPAKQPGRSKKRSREAAADEALPTAREHRLLEQNARLSAQLRIRTTADRARKLLRESAIPEKMRPEILPLMIGKSEDEMRKVVRYHERFIQTAIAEASGYSTEVEGAGSRFREGAGEANAVDAALSGLPLKS
jgi:hypothetical protein